MAYKVYSDASFNNIIKVGTVSVNVMKDNKSACVLTYLIKCENPCEAELRAIDRAMLLILRWKEKNKIDKNERVHFYTDCEGVCVKLNKMKSIKGIKKFYMNSVLANVKKINNERNKNIFWIPRRQNKAHKYGYIKLREELKRAC